MNAIIIDPLGWITVTRAAELKGFPRQTLMDFIREKNVPTRMMKANVCVRLMDVDEAIGKEDGDQKGERRRNREKTPEREVPTQADGRRKAIHRPSSADAI